MITSNVSGIRCCRHCRRRLYYKAYLDILAPAYYLQFIGLRHYGDTLNVTSSRRPFRYVTGQVGREEEVHVLYVSCVQSRLRW
ncbi:uncharacterized protein K489DRAFT_382170 [Dissoconium aciculare CBS 342.82]|jgi:hypothetical protein|uniref:Uncharacterized protein n=1 Tax=Dissoconium aciculare CBS 342.82 TaxID=1314786 RepID=A0A6J3LZE1_9PEZI|nr:uncharacterized protein K489DRAFT_382170 [Dissoconium aciculare CBS 342.82]KAF1821131.1 hypothetical protein K489DRAFT_382170 [Dissoconium aciculare CBS 342.82]